MAKSKKYFIKFIDGGEYAFYSESGNLMGVVNAACKAAVVPAEMVYMVRKHTGCITFCFRDENGKNDTCWMIVEK